jgi:hypothetical protein
MTAVLLVNMLPAHATCSSDKRQDKMTHKCK